MKLSCKQILLFSALCTTLVQTDAQALVSPATIKAAFANLTHLKGVAVKNLKHLPLPAKLVVYPTIAIPMGIGCLSATWGFLTNSLQLWSTSNIRPNTTFKKSLKVLHTLTPGFSDSARGWVGIGVIPPLGSGIATYDTFKWCAKRVGEKIKEINQTLAKNVALKTNKNEKL